MFKGLYDQGRITVATDGTLRIGEVEMSDAGDYECEANNAIGIVSAKISLEVRGKSSLLRELKSV